MARLIVLSEIDILGYLNSVGIYPAEFYTDFDMFKNRAYSFTEDIVISVFAGSCRFSKRQVLEFMNSLSAASGSDGQNTYILSDCLLPACKKYYLYRNTLTSISEYSGWRCTDVESEMWGSLSYDICHTPAVYLSAYDRGDVELVMEELLAQDTSADELRKIIKIPKLFNVNE